MLKKVKKYLTSYCNKNYCFGNKSLIKDFTLVVQNRGSNHQQKFLKNEKLIQKKESNLWKLSTQNDDTVKKNYNTLYEGLDNIRSNFFIFYQFSSHFEKTN